MRRTISIISSLPLVRRGGADPVAVVGYSSGVVGVCEYTDLRAFERLYLRLVRIDGCSV